MEGDGRPRRPGIKDVARRAGVSHQTVSRVLNAHPSVRPGTREKVQAAIAELGYRRNLSARTLVTQRSGTIGVITTGSAQVGPASTTVAIEVAARGHGFATQLVVLDQADDARAAFDNLADRAVEGIVIVAARRWLAEAVRAAAPAVPVVMVAAAPAADGVRVAAVDQEFGARAAVRHLVDGGRRRIAHLAGPDDWFDASERAKGWRGELADAGLEPGPLLRGDWSPACGYRAGLSLAALRRSERPDAVVAANDQMALGLLRAFRDAGIAVPDDVAVVGFDDIAGTAYYTPSLTTVRQPFDELGVLALDVLVEAMAGAAQERSTIAPTLVVRESTVTRGRTHRDQNVS